MKLQKWLDKKGWTREQFGQQFQDEQGNPKPVASQTVDGWCADTPKLPQKRYRAEIERITGKQVRMKDFII